MCLFFSNQFFLNAKEVTHFLLNAFENEFLSHPDLLGPDFFDFDPAMFDPPSPSESLTRSVELWCCSKLSVPVIKPEKNIFEFLKPKPKMFKKTFSLNNVKYSVQKIMWLEILKTPEKNLNFGHFFGDFLPFSEEVHTAHID